MAKQTINIGATPNDGTGTPLRTSFDYTNQNFTELYTALGGGVGLPGSTTQVIFNDGGTNLAGDAGLTYDKTTDALTVVGALSGSKLTVTGGTIPANGVYLPAANTLEFSANSLAQYRIAPLGVFSWYDGAGGTRMTLNSTGLGIGAAPSQAFTLFGKALIASANPDVDALKLTANTGTNAVAINFSNTGGQYYFGVDNSVGGRFLGFPYSLNVNTAGAYPIVLSTSNVARLVIDSTGNALVGVSSANANGGVLQLKSGITFPATQVAATDVNTLDDYEEGTFVPTIVGGTIAGVGVYTGQKGIYTKIGNLVTFQIIIGWTAHTGTGDMTVSGLPFTSNSTSGQWHSVAIGQNNGIALTASNILTAVIVNSSTSIAFQQYPSGGGGSSSVPIDGTATVVLGGSYMV